MNMYVGAPVVHKDCTPLPAQRKRWLYLTAMLMTIALAPSARAEDAPTSTTTSDQAKKAEDERRKKRYGKDYVTRPFWNRRYTYRLDFPVSRIIEAAPGTSCDVKSNSAYSAGKNSIFVEYSRAEDKGNVTLIGEFEYINDEGVSNEAAKPELGKAYKVCIGVPAVDNNMISPWDIRRAGGVDTGILVIPFKVRQGDLFSDSTIGPYFAFSGSVFTLLTTFGLSQVTVKASGETDVKTETGLTFAIGTVWRLKKDWNIGLVVGVDHLSGEAGRNFTFQDSPWWSFAIGYQFAQ